MCLVLRWRKRWSVERENFDWLTDQQARKPVPQVSPRQILSTRVRVQALFHGWNRGRALTGTEHYIGQTKFPDPVLRAVSIDDTRIITAGGYGCRNGQESEVLSIFQRPVFDWHMWCNRICFITATINIISLHVEKKKQKKTQDWNWKACIIKIPALIIAGYTVCSLTYIIRIHPKPENRTACGIIDYRCYDSRFWVSASWLSSPNPALLSNSETRVHLGRRRWKRCLFESAQCQLEAIGVIYFTET